MEALPHFIEYNLTALKREMVSNILVPVHAAAAFATCLDKGLAGHRMAIHVKMTVLW